MYNCNRMVYVTISWFLPALIVTHRVFTFTIFPFLQSYIVFHASMVSSPRMGLWMLILYLKSLISLEDT